jgi:hypothetical protein
MKKSDVYEVAVKILGLYMATYLFSLVQTLVSSIILLFPENSFPNSGTTNFFTFLAIVVYTGLLLAFLYLLIFKTKQVVKKLCSASDYEEDVKLFTDKKTILEIALLIIGGTVAIWALPDLASQLYNLFTLARGNFNISLKDREIRYLVVVVVRLIIGILVVLDAKPLAAFFTKEKKQEN